MADPAVKPLPGNPAMAADAASPNDAAARLKATHDILHANARTLVISVISVVVIIVVFCFVEKLVDSFPLVVLVALLAIIGQCIYIIRNISSLDEKVAILLTNKGVGGKMSVYLAPAVLSIMLYIAFVSGLISGKMFPEFNPALALTPEQIAVANRSNGSPPVSGAAGGSQATSAPAPQGQQPANQQAELAKGAADTAGNHGKLTTITFKQFLGIAPKGTGDIALLLIYGFFCGFASASFFGLLEKTFIPK